MQGRKEKNETCTWTAWGDLICEKISSRMFGVRENFTHKTRIHHDAMHDNTHREGFEAQSTCQVDSDCNTSSRCDNLNTNEASWSCKPCADIGCAAGKTCDSSSDCGEALACKDGVCTSGMMIVSQQGNSYNAEYNAYQETKTESSTKQKVFDCTDNNTCKLGDPCDESVDPSQCTRPFRCNDGICKSTLGGYCDSNDDCLSSLFCSDNVCTAQ